jgi:hypothetical protein
MNFEVCGVRFNTEAYMEGLRLETFKHVSGQWIVAGQPTSGIEWEGLRLLAQPTPKISFILKDPTNTNFTTTGVPDGTQKACNACCARNRRSP